MSAYDLVAQIVLLSVFLTDVSDVFPQFAMFICCAGIIAIIQYCNFCQLSYWMRSALATLVGLALLALLYISPCR